MTNWDEFSIEHKDALAGALFEAWTAYERRDRTKAIGPTIIAPLFDAIVKVADERSPKPTFWGFDPASPDGDRSVEVRVGPGGTIRGWRIAMPDRDAFNDVKRGEFRRLEEVVASLAQHVDDMGARLQAVNDAAIKADDELKYAFDRQIKDALALIDRCVSLAERNSARLSAIEGTVDVGIAELSSRLDGLTPPRLRGIGIDDTHKPTSAIKYYFGDDATFGKLPIELRKRWWKETDYGGNAPSVDLKRAVNAVLPGHFPDVPPSVEAMSLTPGVVADALKISAALKADTDEIDPLNKDFVENVDPEFEEVEPDPLDITAEAPFSTFDGEDNLNGRVDPLIQEARDRAKALYEGIDDEPEHPELHRQRRDSED